MFFELLRRSDRGIGNGKVGMGRSLRTIDSPLDLTDIVEVLGKPRAITSSDARLQASHGLGHRIENAAPRAHTLAPLVDRPGATEQPLEDDARVDLHRQR